MGAAEPAFNTVRRSAWCRLPGGLAGLFRAFLVGLLAGQKSRLGGAVMEILFVVLMIGMLCGFGLWLASRPTLPEKKPGADFDGI